MPSLLPLRIDTSKDQEDPTPPTPPEICLSPSWSDHGEKKRKKEKKRMEKEQKEMEKRLKQDQERQQTADIKAGKRLSKNPPPAAMETQKMPQSLRRSSWVSIISSRTSSGENTRRSSREEKRLSGISIGSIDSQSHSRSTPATSTEEASDLARNSGQVHSVVSSAAPKIPNFGWSSRRTSSGTSKSVSWGSEDEYAREVISFAYRLDGSPTDSEHDKSHEPKAQQAPTTLTKQESVMPRFSRSSTEPNLVTVLKQSAPESPQRPSAKRQDSPEFRTKHGQTDLFRNHRDSVPPPKTSPNFQRDLAGEMEAIMAGHHQNSNQNPPSPRSPQRSSHDGSSYVHKQRMYQQQRSIAGFEDEQAVKDANEKAAKYEGLVGDIGQQAGLDSTGPDTHRRHSNTKSDASNVTNDRVPASPRTRDSVMQRNSELSPPKQQSLVKQQVGVAHSSSLKPTQTEATQKGQQETQSRASSQSVRSSLSLNKVPTAPGSKTDKILGFRRRSKVAPSNISIPDTVQKSTLAPKPVPVTVIEELSGKRLKLERMSQETSPTQIHASSRKRSENSFGNQPRGSLPEPKPIQSHARSRTSSSGVLSENLPSPMSLMSPNTATEPDLITSNKAAKQLVASGSGRELRLEAEPNSANSKHMNPLTADKAPPEILTTTKDAATAEATSSTATPTPKHSPEVVVESRTEEGLIRKTSIKRPRSNPQLQTQTTMTNSLPSLDFLPQLKHQPFVKRQPQFLPVAKDRFPPVPKDYATIKSMAGKQTSTTHAPDLELIPRSPLRVPSEFPVPGQTFNRSSTDVGTVSFGKGALGEGMEAKPIAKLFVICCKCKFWHDLPSKLYEAMALPKELQPDESGGGGKGKVKFTGGRLETAVKCPWCEHAMTTWCCQGWTTVVYLHERHH